MRGTRITRYRVIVENRHGRATYHTVPARLDRGITVALMTNPTRITLEPIETRTVVTLAEVMSMRGGSAN